MRTLPLLLLVVLALGCNDAPAGAAPGTSTAAVAAPAAAPAPAPARRAVAKIVFVDKEHACECTQKAIDATATALAAVLAGKPVPVERVHLDTQRDQVAAYVKLRPLVALPALYLFDEAGGLVEVVQGESDEAKLRPFVN